MNDYGNTFGIYNYHKMITDATAFYIDKAISSDRLADRKFCQCWDNVEILLMILPVCWGNRALYLIKRG